MIHTTTDSIPGREVVEILGIVRGSSVRARNIGRDIFAGLKNIVGVEIDEYTKLQADSREQALQRMIRDAENLNANAVVTTKEKINSENWYETQGVQPPPAGDTNDKNKEEEST